MRLVSFLAVTQSKQNKKRSHTAVFTQPVDIFTTSLSADNCCANFTLSSVKMYTRIGGFVHERKLYNEAFPYTGPSVYIRHLSDCLCFVYLSHRYSMYWINILVEVSYRCYLSIMFSGLCFDTENIFFFNLYVVNNVVIKAKRPDGTCCFCSVFVEYFME